MAASAAAGVMAASAVTNAITKIGETVLNQYNADKTRQFNREEAEKNRAFQREMAQNNIKYAVNQANELGISPSLVLGDQTKQLGGSQASVGNPNPSNIGNIGNGLTNLANVLQEQIKLNTMQEMNEDKLQTMKDIQLMKMKNATTNNDYIHQNYTKEQVKNIPINDLDNWQV